jgi:hypothetical protein
MSVEDVPCVFIHREVANRTDGIPPGKHVGRVDEAAQRFYDSLLAHEDVSCLKFKVWD